MNTRESYVFDHCNSHVVPRMKEAVFFIAHVYTRTPSKIAAIIKSVAYWSKVQQYGNAVHVCMNERNTPLSI